MNIPERWLTEACLEAAEGRPARAVGIAVMQNPFVERWLAQSHPALPFVLFAPVSLGCLFAGARATGTAPAIGGFAAGLALFSVVEYALHRLLFHRRFSPTRAGRIEEFLTHSYHHIYPNDPVRLVLPPIATVPLACLLAASFVMAFGRGVGLSGFSGFVAGYVTYDTLHYFVHHARPATALGKWLRQYHLLHHHDHRPLRFGVTSPIWDLVFGTFAPVGRAARRSAQKSEA